jgi:integrase
MNMTAVEINFPRYVLMPGFSRPCSGYRLPRGSGKRIVRAVLKPEQVVAIAKRLPEPYPTLVLVLAVTGLRIGESIGIKWSDFDGDVLKIQRRIYEGEADDTKTENSNRSLHFRSVPNVAAPWWSSRDLPLSRSNSVLRPLSPESPHETNFPKPQTSIRFSARSALVRLAPEKNSRP